MLCKTRRKDPTLSHNIGDFTTFNGSQSSAYAKEVLKTERYRFLFYAKKPPKIQQFTHVQRHWEKIRPIFQKYLICSYLILPCSHRAFFHKFQPNSNQIFISWKSCWSDEEMSILITVLWQLFWLLVRTTEKTWLTWLFSKTTASWGIKIFST